MLPQEIQRPRLDRGEAIAGLRFCTVSANLRALYIHVASLQSEHDRKLDSTAMNDRNDCAVRFFKSAYNAEDIIVLYVTESWWFAREACTSCMGFS